MWGTSWRQRLRLMPLYLAMVAADRCAAWMPRRARHVAAPWQPGLSIVIPERGAPAMLDEALVAVAAALAGVDEAHEVIVVVNGTPLSDYAAVQARHPRVTFLHAQAPLGFAGAVDRGIAHARYEGVYLLNNDMVVDAQALAAVMALRAPDVFAIGSQIEQRSADGRREETGFVDWFTDRDGIRLFHANVPADGAPCEHLAASGGAALFRREPLRTYLRASRAYDPFYWEDAEWGVQAWRDGWRVLYCPASRARHRHRATTARFYAAAELERIVERNRWLFDARNGLTPHGPAWLLDRVCALPGASQRELAAIRVALATFRQRCGHRRAPQPLPPSALAHPDGRATALRDRSYSFRMRAHAPGNRPRLLLVTPFAVYPPRHGGARRVAALLAGLRADFDVILVSDEALLYDARSFAYLDGLHAVHLVQRRDDATDGATEDATTGAAATLPERMRAHAHPALAAAVADAIARYAPRIVQIEHAELTPLVRLRAPGTPWVLDLHDAYTEAEFGADHAMLAQFDAVAVVAAEDAALVTHPRVTCIANGSEPALEPGRPSTGAMLLFVGPFRYAPNRDGIEQFLTLAWPPIRAAIPAATMLILAGNEYPMHVAGRAAFAQPGITLAGHRDDVSVPLGQCALTVNPLAGIRGSAVKIAESLTASRVCISTIEGARGYLYPVAPGLVVVGSVEAMVAPVLELLRDTVERHRLEALALANADRLGWGSSTRALRELHASLLEVPLPANP
jgi:GT2 family glycosyltransferase